MVVFPFSPLGLLLSLFVASQKRLAEFGPSQPQQIHLSLGRSSSEVIVTWTTYSASDVSLVEFGESELLQKSVRGYRTVFRDDGPLKRRHYIHRVALANLKPHRRYYYRCGSGKNWSRQFSFRTLSSAANGSATIAAFGDMDAKHGRVLPAIGRLIAEERVDVLLHNGDMAYNLASNNSFRGDEFMRTIEQVAAWVPYQTSPGNHEQAYNFSHYHNRFTMYDMTSPSSRKADHFYAFHLGRALVISINTELYFLPQYFARHHHKTQYRWLEAVLKEANSAENRLRRPWIILFGHRPMYCSNAQRDCYKSSLVLRDNLEHLLHAYKVDLAVWAHEHSYERTWPVYNCTVQSTNATTAYINPTGTVHLVSGTGGSFEGLYKFKAKAPQWSAFRAKQYGYSLITVLNGTHLSVKQTWGTTQDTIVDEFTIIQKSRATKGSGDSSEKTPSSLSPNAITKK